MWCVHSRISVYKDTETRREREGRSQSRFTQTPPALASQFVLGHATFEVIADAGVEYAGRAGEDVDVIDGHCGDFCMMGGILRRLAQKWEVVPWNEVGMESCHDPSLRSG